RDMCAIAGLGAGAIERARKGFQPVLHIAEAARIEERLARHATRAPVLLDAVCRLDAELVIELAIAERAQRLLVEDRDPTPLVCIFETVEAHLLQPRPPERRAQRLLYRVALPFGLDAADLRARLGQAQRHCLTGDRPHLSQMRKIGSVPILDFQDADVALLLLVRRRMPGHGR